MDIPSHEMNIIERFMEPDALAVLCVILALVLLEHKSDKARLAGWVFALASIVFFSIWLFGVS